MKPQFFVGAALPLAAHLAFGAPGAHGFSASPEERQAFEEMLAVKWLNCRFAPVTTASGEIVTELGYDEKTGQFTLKTHDPSEKHGDNELDLLGPSAVFVFNDAKTLAVVHFPDDHAATQIPQADLSVEVTSVDVQRVDFANPGALQLAVKYHLTFESTWSDTNEITLIGGIMIFPSGLNDRRYVAVSTIFGVAGVHVRSASCSDEIGDESRDAAERLRAELSVAAND